MQGEWVDDERCGQGTLYYNTGEVYQGGWAADLQGVLVMAMRGGATQTWAVEESFIGILILPVMDLMHCSGLPGLAVVCPSQIPLCKGDTLSVCHTNICMCMCDSANGCAPVK